MGTYVKFTSSSVLEGFKEALSIVYSEACYNNNRMSNSTIKLHI